MLSRASTCEDHLMFSKCQEPPSQSGRGAQRHQPHHQGSQGALAWALAPKLRGPKQPGFWGLLGWFLRFPVPSGKRLPKKKKLLKITILNVSINYKWPCSIAMLVYQREMCWLKNVEGNLESSPWDVPWPSVCLSRDNSGGVKQYRSVDSRWQIAKDRKKTKNIKHSGNLTKNATWRNAVGFNNQLCEDGEQWWPPVVPDG